MPIRRPHTCFWLVLFLLSTNPATGAQQACAEMLTNPAPATASTKLSFDFRNADLHDVLRILAQEGDFNLIVTDDVQGQVTLQLRNVTWYQALETVLQAHGLMLRQQGTIAFVDAVTGQ